MGHRPPHSREGRKFLFILFGVLVILIGLSALACIAVGLFGLIAGIWAASSGETRLKMPGVELNTSIPGIVLVVIGAGLFVLAFRLLRETLDI